MRGIFFWNEQPIPFFEGQTIASALVLSGIRDFGPYSQLTNARYFCGIGACQSCLVTCDGGPAIEACITIAADGVRLQPFSSKAERSDV